MSLRIRTCHLGPVQVNLITNSQAVLDVLGEFYQVSETTPSPSSWTVEVNVAPSTPDMTVNRWGVGYLATPQTKRILLHATDSHHLAITARKTVREVLIDYCEQRRYVMLHASAVVDDDRVIVVVGDKGSGKTTLALKSVLSHGMRYLSNDHLIIYSDDSAPQPTLTLTSLPTPIPLKIGTYLDLERHLPRPWDTEGLDIDAYRRRGRKEVYGIDRRVLYTFRGLGQSNPIQVVLGDSGTGPSVLVVLARYANGSAGPAVIGDPVGALMEHVRTDWMFDRNLNQRCLPRRERGVHEYRADARSLVRRLADRARVVQWCHRGEPSELLGVSGRETSRS